jgi:hypothetical protein
MAAGLGRVNIDTPFTRSSQIFAWHGMAWHAWQHNQNTTEHNTTGLKIASHAEESKERLS